MFIQETTINNNIKNKKGIIINSVSSHRTSRKIMTDTVYYENE
jgi:hypothetical protein